MLVNDLQNHKQKYSIEKQRLMQINVQRKLELSYYDRYFKSMRKTEQNQQSLYLRIKKPQTQKVSMKQLNTEDSQRQSIRMLTNQYQFEKNIPQQQIKKHKSKGYIRKFNLCDNQTENLTYKEHFSEQNIYKSVKHSEFFERKSSGYLLDSKKLVYEGKNRQRRRIFNPQRDFAKQKKTILIPKKKGLINRKTQFDFKAKSAQVATMLIQKEQQLNFLRKLQYNELFFCSKCYRYIFGIQKPLHYPECNSALHISQMNEDERINTGKARIQMIKQLSEYTNIKNDEIKQILLNINSQQYNKPINTTMKKRYLNIQEIETAIEIIYNEILNNNQLNEKNAPEKISFRNIKKRNQ